MSLLTNTASMVALQNLRIINSDLEDVQKQISTGLKISSAQDNAAIFSITTVMNSDVKGFEAISESLSLATATLGVALDAAETVAGLLSDMKQHIVSAQEDNVDRATINDEVLELKEQIDGIVSAASFNGLTLVEGDGEISFLAALNRGSDDSVTASHISVGQHSLEQTSGTAVDGLSLATTSGASGYVDATGTLTDGSSTATTYDLLIDDAATFTAGDVWSINIDNGTSDQTVTYTVQDGDDHDAVAAGLTAAITGAGITGITSATTAGGAGADSTVTITNANAATQTVTVDVNSASGDGISSATVGAVESVYLTELSGLDTTLSDGETYTVGLDNTATYSEGDVWEFIIGGQSITYEVQAGDDHDAVATGINDAIAAAGLTDVTATVTPGGAGVDATIDITNNSGEELELTVAINAGDAGGLRNLADLDVSTALGARTALTAIEDLIDVSVDAAAAFGSSMSRIDIQVEFVSNFTDALRTGIGALVDADLEEASARLQSLQVQQQLGIQALSIATQSSQNILALFQ